MDYKDKIREILKDNTIPEEQRKKLEEILLAAEISEDENIRKELVNYFTEGREFLSLCSFGRDEILAWLKKSSEKKSTDNLTQQEAMDIAVAKCFNEQEAVDMVEPKFNVGNWICNSACIVHIASIKDGMYYFDEGDGLNITFVDNNYHLWSIADAKDGDILAEDSCIFIIQKLGDNSTVAKTHCTLYDDGVFDDGTILYFDINSTKPATKEQHELLFQKMHKAGYEWSAEMKELMRIEDICMYSTDNYTDEERKTLCEGCNISCKYNLAAWSEEDKRIMLAISQLLKDCESENDWNCVYSNDREVFFADIEKWIQSLKDRFSTYQNNLSADDEINYRILQAIIRNSDTSSTLANKLSDWLVSLKNRVIPQPKEWNKEDEQIASSVEQVMNCATLLNIVPEKIDKVRTWLQSLKQRVKGE